MPNSAGPANTGDTPGSDLGVDLGAGAGTADGASTGPGLDARVGAATAAAVLRAVFDRAAPPGLALSRPQLVAAASWLRDRAGSAVRTGQVPRAAFTAAVPLAAQLHATACVAGPSCPALVSAARAIELEVTGAPEESDVELGAALAAASGDSVLALAALAAALVVVVDGAGAAAVIRAVTAPGR